MFSILLASILSFASEDADRAYSLADKFVNTCTPRDAGTVRGRNASFWILDNASAVGANVKRDQFTVNTPNGRKTLANLYAEFRAPDSDEWIVLVSHYDTKWGVDCPGANDGASTTALLIALANRLFDCRDLKKNVMLVWTDGEECMKAYSDGDGLFGSRRAVEIIRQRGLDVRAVVCLDMLGDKDLHIAIPSNTTEALSKIAWHAARRIGEKDLVTFSSDVVTDDHVPFVDAGISAVNLIDFSYGPNNSWWHTPEDSMDKISRDSLLKSGRLVCELLNLLLKM